MSNSFKATDISPWETCKKLLSFLPAHVNYGAAIKSKIKASSHS